MKKNFLMGLILATICITSANTQNIKVPSVISNNKDNGVPINNTNNVSTIQVVNNSGTDGMILAGTWFNMSLQNKLVASKNNQKFEAKTLDIIYSKDFSKALVPAGAIVKGIYNSDDNKCSFEINSVQFQNTTINLSPGTYSTVITALGHVCNPKINYNESQILDFQLKMDILNLKPIFYNLDYYIEDSSNDDLVELSTGDDDYAINRITQFTNGLIQVSVLFVDRSNLSSTVPTPVNLVPVFYDEDRSLHPLNFIREDIMDDMKKPKNKQILIGYRYLFSNHYKNMAFGIME